METTQEQLICDPFNLTQEELKRLANALDSKEKESLKSKGWGNILGDRSYSTSTGIYNLESRNSVKVWQVMGETGYHARDKSAEKENVFLDANGNAYLEDTGLYAREFTKIQKEKLQRNRTSIEATKKSLETLLALDWNSEENFGAVKTKLDETKDTYQKQIILNEEDMKPIAYLRGHEVLARPIDFEQFKTMMGKPEPRDRFVTNMLIYGGIQPCKEYHERRYKK